MPLSDFDKQVSCLFYSASGFLLKVHLQATAFENDTKAFIGYWMCAAAKKISKQGAFFSKAKAPAGVFLAGG